MAWSVGFVIRYLLFLSLRLFLARIYSQSIYRVISSMFLDQSISNCTVELLSLLIVVFSVHISCFMASTYSYLINKGQTDSAVCR